MLIVDNFQIASISESMSCEKMKLFLFKHFPESRLEPDAEMCQGLLQSVRKARVYSITQENELYAFVSAAWLLGMTFDQDFPEVAAVLENFDIASFEKAEFLWGYCKNLFVELESI